jgi:hypothetical protein
MLAGNDRTGMSSILTSRYSGQYPLPQTYIPREKAQFEMTFPYNL